MYVSQALDLLEGLIPMGDEARDMNAKHLRKLIVFAIMWSLGAILELEDRKKVNIILLSFKTKLFLREGRGAMVRAWCFANEEKV